MENRSVFVIELLCPEPVGRGDEGNEKVVKFLAKLAEVLDQKPERGPVSHLSKKYGLAGWLPLTRGGAIHLYAWDNRKPSLVSVDVTGSFPIYKKHALRYAGRYFGVSDGNNIVSRSISPPPPTWKELARDVYRQRLTLLADDCQRPRSKKVVEFLPELAEEIDMIPLYTVHTKECHAWMHWETSGSVLSWLNGCLSLDIYTCKPFSAKRAICFTTRYFRTRNLKSYSY
ncbi:MAG: hypothetical protein JXA30_17010 [Deltaproteobacteria bacterium]|nr:hypothetical protein [Deltaproteobacteria bacterium]